MENEILFETFPKSESCSRKNPKWQQSTFYMFLWKTCGQRRKMRKCVAHPGKRKIRVEKDKESFRTLIEKNVKYWAQIQLAPDPHPIQSSIHREFF